MEFNLPYFHATIHHFHTVIFEFFSVEENYIAYQSPLESNKLTSLTYWHGLCQGLFTEENAAKIQCSMG